MIYELKISINKKMIYLDENSVESLITWDNSYEATKEALRCASSGCAVTGERVFTPIFGGKWMAPMPGYLNHEKYGAWACKILINCPQNATLTKPLPVFTANIYYMDMDTGILQAAMEGVTITSYRTAAASVIATKYIYSGISRDGNILTILGAGEQGKSHADAFHHFFNFAEIRIWNRSAEKAKKLTEVLNEKYGKQIFRFFANNEEAVRGADVIITATNPGRQPVLKYEWVKQGAHINAIGVSSGTSNLELEPEIYKHAEIYTDCKSIASKFLNGILTGSDIDITAEIGEIIGGNGTKPKAENKITIFQSFGIPAQDCAMARMIFDAYKNSKKSN